MCAQVHMCTQTHAGSPSFGGWMITSTPSSCADSARRSALSLPRRLCK